MRRYLHSSLIILSTVVLVRAQSEQQIVIGSHHKLFSKVLNEERGFWINLPESYHNKSASYKAYPLLILLDGHAHFRSVSGSVHYMSAGYNGNRRIPEMIVVAIQNVSRTRDYTPDKIVTTRKNDFGGGDNFLKFLDTELIPHLESNYRTQPYRILYGHSLGGLLAVHSYMKDHSSFNAFIAVDPSFGAWDEKMMDGKLDTLAEESFDRYLYIATANWQKRNIRNRDRHVRLYESLDSKCYGPFPGELEFFENEDHGSVPLIAFHNGISSIFKGYGINYRDIQSIDQLENHFKNISERLSWDFAPPEALVNRLGYRFLRQEPEKAIEFFRLNTQNYPASYNVFDSLAEAYESTGDKTKAIENYKKSLSLNPDNENAARKIEVLELK